MTYTSISTVCRYIGTVYELPTAPKVGDICFYNGGEYVYNGDKWEIFGDICDTVDEPAKILPTTCSRCGAALKNGVCEYCGTDYR